ncbi:multidrug efflux MFS transporter [Paenibacillus sp. N1-5-1-14]|uniref:MDR family MFS transporter n=1 Tax=Paenibacillus radicibacter TaxID=2972488 RepID=UPI002158A759|nr:MDR family MFS transporter [Paenibacillus radicibacter]MCR8641184.1 multidrug efflux MFS transporter [Paenibacillus radicibacter]
MSSGAQTNVLQERPQTIRQILAPLITIIIGMFMVILDGTAVNVALPGFVKDFNSSYPVVQWTVMGYALAQAAVIPLAGWLSDRFGSKNIFLISLAFFTLGSLLCALATDITQLITYRIIQGIGGGMVMPIAMAFIYRISPPDKIGAVMGMMGIPILLAPALGPILAGYLVDYVNWTWIFLINIPIGIIGLIFGIRKLPKIERQSVPALDLLGMILAPLAFAALCYGISEGATDWSSSKTLIGLGVGVGALILFIIVEFIHKQPLLELRVFKSWEFSRAIIIQWITQVALFGTMFLVPLFLQQAKGYSAFDTGLIMLPQALAAGLMMPISGKLSDKIGARPLVMAGMAIVTIAAFLLSQIKGDDGIIMMIIPLILLGAGMGLSMMPLQTHLMKTAPQNLVSRVTALINALQQVVGAFAVAGLTTILTSQMKQHITEGVPPTIDTWAASFGDTFFVLIGVGALGIILALLLSKPKKLQNDDSSETPQPQIVIH